MPLSSNKDLHGAAPDRCAVALLLIDWINDLEFEGGEKLFPQALTAAKAVAALRRRAKQAGVPVIYCNDGRRGLFTAQDAYMRDFRLLVPRDCMASEEACKADTGPWSAIDFARLRKAA